MLLLLLTVSVNAQKLRSNDEYERNLSLSADSILKKVSVLSMSTADSQFKERNQPIEIRRTRKFKRRLSPGGIYKKVASATVVITGGCLCDHCSNLHVNPASGYFISEDGICVTNYHVIDSYIHPGEQLKPKLIVVKLHDGRVLPVQEVLTASKENDLAIVKVDTNGAKVPALGLDVEPEIGDDVYIVSHPQKLFYQFSKGMVTNKFRRKFPDGDNGFLERDLIAVSADYATGSSGAAIVNKYGNVVATVSSTRTLKHWGLEDKPTQMVVKEGIPAASLEELLK